MENTGVPASPSGHSAEPEPRVAPGLGHSASVPNAWRPIETAPKDGTEVDLYGSWRNQDGSIYRGRFPSCEWGELASGGQAWLYDGIGLVEHSANQARITHWMPLPEPPQSEGAGA
jgi:hypothetical protein